MQVVQTIAAARHALHALRGGDKSLALVPTMGALHAGHLSLVARARSECQVVAASLFVNPLQFGPGEDFDRYPRQLASDLGMFEHAGVNLVFAPPVEEMYPFGPATSFVEVGDVGERLDGAHRPGHFRGVATVVAKLFHIIQPDRAFFGQKDAVQVAVLRRMIRDLNFPVELVACPIVRDPDGLALSSRNAYLTPDERRQALVLSRALETMRLSLANGMKTQSALIGAGRQVVQSEPAVVLEYLEAVEPLNLHPVEEIAAGTLVVIAARVGKTRLIDNFIA